jgi:hypothetical protein
MLTVNCGRNWFIKSTPAWGWRCQGPLGQAGHLGQVSSFFQIHKHSFLTIIFFKNTQYQFISSY